MDGKIKALNIDDLVWYIYIFISVAALYSNKLEKEYIKTKGRRYLSEFHTINLIVLTIAFIVYVYFVFVAFSRYSIKKNTSTLINLVASILFLIGGGTFLYLEALSTDSDINNVGI